jgi:SAM-dependent methyltransferase
VKPLTIAALVLSGVATWEAGWWLRRRVRRQEQYQVALQAARSLNRPLVVIGAPDGGMTSGYGCGDVTVDLQKSSMCPVAIQADVTKTLPFADSSAVVVVMCVLEYVDDANAALAEIYRVSGGYAYFVGVEPWTLTAYLYPGAKRTLPAVYR